MNTALPLDSVRSYLRDLQNRICGTLEQEDGVGRFIDDPWRRTEGGGGLTRVLVEGRVFEQAGVNFSEVHGARLPPAASAQRPDLA
nr:coproporphyrinogen III oxidase [Pseudomonadota bacterium]